MPIPHHPESPIRAVVAENLHPRKEFYVIYELNKIPTGNERKSCKQRDARAA